MPPRWRTNPLALAVLTCLFERPMHPYEMAQTMRTRAKHESIRLNYGSLYSVVESMEKRGLVEAVATTQEGRRPQRTVYGITEAGKVEMTEWLADLVAVPTKEYLQFEAALSPVESRTGLASSTHIHVVMHLSGVPSRIEDENVERIRPNVPSI